MEGKHDKYIMSPQYNSSSLPVSKLLTPGTVEDTPSLPTASPAHVELCCIAGGDLMLISEGTGGGGGWQDHE